MDVKDVKFTIGKLVGTSWRVWGRNFGSIFVLTAMIYLPVIIWGYLVAETDWGLEGVDLSVDYRPWLDRSVMLTKAVGCSPPLLGMVVPALVSHGVVMDLRGERLPFGAYIARGLSRFFPALITLTLVAICIGGATIGVTFLLSLGGRVNESAGEVIQILGGGLTGLYAWSTLYVALPASVVDRPGSLGALRQSWALTRGHRLEIGILQLLPLALQFVLMTVVALLGVGLESRVYTWIVGAALLGSFSATMAPVAYHCLRVEKAQRGAAELAMTFE